MKILVLSDSHSALRFMYACMHTVRPDAVVHLGDHYDDGLALREDHPGVRFYQVPGNCDRYRCDPRLPEILIERVLGVNLYMTHGHKHNVKMYLAARLREARACRGQAVLYGQPHVADCHQEEDGLWVLNPGSGGYGGGSAGLIEVENGTIKTCRILRQADLEDMQ